MIFLTPQSYASPTPGGEEGGISAKGLKTIVRTMRDDKRERMPGLLSQAMAEELPPEGDDKRPAGEALAGCAPAGLSRRPTGRRACVRTLTEMGVAAYQSFASSGPRAPPDLVMRDPLDT